MTGWKVVDVTDALEDGIDGKGMSEKHSIRAIFRDFADLPHERGESTQSAILSCHSREWAVQVFPGGDSGSSRDREYVSLFLKCLTVTQIPLKAMFRFRATAGSQSKKMGLMETNLFSTVNDNWGNKQFVSRADVLDPAKGFLVDGNLTIEVDIQLFTADQPWRPKTTLNRDFLKILASGKQSGDVKFQVGGKDFPVHRHILEARAPTLAALAEGYPSDAPIPIQNANASAFGALLRFVYADDVPEPECLQEEARELLDVADRFGCAGLKLAAEAELAASGVTVDTAADMILLGDAKNCALLKEAAVDFFAVNPASVMASSGWHKVKQSTSLLSELMEALAFSKKRSAPGDPEERGYKQMCVSDLRRKLDARGLDVDGSKEMLINRLRNEEENDIDDSDEDDTDDSSHEDE